MNCTSFPVKVVSENNSCMDVILNIYGKVCCHEDLVRGELFAESPHWSYVPHNHVKGQYKIKLTDLFR